MNTDDMDDKIFNRNFIKISLACIILMSANSIIMTVLPLLLEHLNHPPVILGIATSVSAFAAMIARPVAGYFADKKSKKLILCAGLVIMILGILGINFLPFVSAIVIIRLIQGFGISAATTSQMAIATDVLPAAQVKKGMSYFGVCTTIAFGVGPVIGLSLVFGDNFLFSWIGGVVLYIAAIVIVASISYKLPAKKQAVDLPIHTSEGKTFKLWRYFEKDALKPSLVQMLLIVSNAGIIVFLPVYATEIGIEQIGIYYILHSLTMFASNVLVGKTIHRFKNPLPFMLISAVCMAGALFALSNTTGMAHFSIAALLHGVGFGVSMTALSATIMAKTTQERRGVASGTFQVSVDMGFFAGPFILGIVAGMVGYRQMYLLLMLLSAVAVVMSFIFFGKRAQSRQTHE